MKIERLEDGYKLTDLYVAATLLCESGMELKEVVQVPGEKKKRLYFYVQGDPCRIKQIIDDFFNAKHMVEANAFKVKVQQLKMKLYVKV